MIIIFLFDISKTYKQTTNENSIQFRYGTPNIQQLTEAGVLICCKSNIKKAKIRYGWVFISLKLLKKGTAGDLVH